MLLPAGFLAVKAEEEIKVMARELAAVFQEQVLLAGIDEENGKLSGEKGQQGETGGKIRKSKEDDEDEEDDESEVAHEDEGEEEDEEDDEDEDDESKVADGEEGYRYWAFASRRGEIVGGPWWQRSAVSGERVSDPSPRIVQVCDMKIGVLICGELYNRDLAESLRGEKAGLVVDLAHLSMTRFTKSLRRVAKTAKCPVLHVQHVAWGAYRVSKWKATPWSVRREIKPDWASYEEEGWDPSERALWAEVKIWEI